MRWPLFLLTASMVVLAVDAEAGSAWDASRTVHYRAQGPDGLKTLMAQQPSEPAAVAAWRRAVDGVAAQRDAAASGLYWYTDLAAAQSAAKAQGKPILSLRLLGRLDEARSCANSRMFRAVLYPDPRVSALLRDRFVLHWRSVRPAPQVTVDFGDGRKWETTLTGNSIHYVLTPEGRALDALPGLYGPAAFHRELKAADGVWRAIAGAEPATRQARIQKHLAERLSALGAPVEPPRVMRQPSALDASRLTASKAVVEMPLLEAIALPATPEGLSVPPQVTPAALKDARLSPESQALIREHLGGAAELSKVVAALELAIAKDQVLNEAQIRPRVLRMLHDMAAGDALEAVNERVYAEVFLTPRTDPFLGLVGPEVYTGLPNNGLKVGE